MLKFGGRCRLAIVHIRLAGVIATFVLNHCGGSLQSATSQIDEFSRDLTTEVRQRLTWNSRKRNFGTAGNLKFLRHRFSRALRLWQFRRRNDFATAICQLFPFVCMSSALAGAFGLKLLRWLMFVATFPSNCGNLNISRFL
jgi:hypothetical protein